jgi:hypothetical protein
MIGSIVGHGTFVGIASSEDFIAVGVDTKTTYDTSILGIYPEHGCKIKILDGNLIFTDIGCGFISRSPETDQGNWIVVYDSKMVAINSNFVGNIAGIANEWGMRTADAFDLYANDRAIQIIGVFAGEEPDGTLGTYAVKVCRNSFSYCYKVSKLPTEIGLWNFNHQNFLDEIFQGRTVRAQAIKERIRSANCSGEMEGGAIRVREIVRAIIEWDGKDVAGDPSVIIIERGKRPRWFARPEVCKNQ